MENNPARIALQWLIGLLAATGLVVILIGVNHSEAGPMGITFSAPDWQTIWIGGALIAWALLALIVMLAATMAARMIIGPEPRHATTTDNDHATPAPAGP